MARNIQKVAIEPRHIRQQIFYNYPSGCSWLWLRTHAVITWVPATIICFDFKIKKNHHSGVRYPRWWMNKAVWVNAANRFYLIFDDVVNYNDITSAANSYLGYVSLMYKLRKRLSFNMSRLKTFWTPLVFQTVLSISWTLTHKMIKQQCA